MKSKPHILTNIIMTSLGVVFALVCLWIGEYPDNKTGFTKGVLAAIWIIVPPVYFFFEWVFLYEETEEYPLEKFQYSQKLAKEAWLAITVILIALYFNSFEFSGTP